MGAPVERILDFFAAYAAIPHPSGDTARGRAWVAEVAEKAGAECLLDGAGNILVRVPATAGYEDHPTVILQGHLDMVAAREPNSPSDPMREGLSLFREGDLFGAHGTTLGGDDGAAVAMLLALLCDVDAAHPPLELLFTADEETGMNGALGFDVAQLKGRLLLNIDSDEEGLLVAGCAGGTKVSISYPVCRETVKGVRFSLALAHASGGHSGMEIGRGGMNANCALAKILAQIAARMPLHLLSLTGGDKDNAIPTHASGDFLVAATDAPDLCALVKAAEEELRARYGGTDPNFTLTLTEQGETAAAAIGCADSARYLGFLTEMPNGVQKMHPTLKGLVQTSLNLGVLMSEENALTALWSLRSALAAEKEALYEHLATAAAAIGAPVCREGDYPAWEYRENSPLRATMEAVYARLFGKKMKTTVLHAGLECGIFSSRLPTLDCVSFGPNMYDIHTTRERLSVSSLERTYRYLLAVLREL